MQIRIINTSGNPLPGYSTAGAAGMDLCANNDEPVVIAPMARVLVPTGIFIEVPEGYEAQVRPRSGLALKHGITLPNSPGTIDSDYRGEVKVIMANIGAEPFVVQKGERIAQLVVAPFERVEWHAVEALTGSNRGAGGFGSTGK